MNKKILLIILLVCSSLAIAQDANTVLLIHAEGPDGSTSFIDSSASAHTITANGDAQIDTAQQKFGSSSALFDGSGDYLSIPDSSDWDFGTGDFTIDLWVRPTSFSSDYTLVGMSIPSGIMQFDIDNNNLRAFIHDATITARIVNGAHGMSLNQWHHVAFVQSNNNLTIYRDGNYIASGSVPSTQSVNGNVIVGARASLASQFPGHIDELRITNGVARWTSNFTPPNAPYSEEDAIPEVSNATLQIFVLLIVALLVGALLLRNK